MNVSHLSGLCRIRAVYGIVQVKGFSVLAGGYVIPLGRFRFVVHLLSDLELPDFAGFRFRGAFGLALKHSVCRQSPPVEKQHCAQCPFRYDCAYTAVFEPQAIHNPTHGTVPLPYIVSAPEGGRYARNTFISFEITLVGTAMAFLPQVVMAVMRMLDKGLGPEKSRGRLEEVSLPYYPGAPVIYQRGDNTLSPFEPLVPEVCWDQPCSAVELQWVTPVRLQHKGALIRPGSVTPSVLFNALMRRIEQVGMYYVPAWQSYADEVIQSAITSLQLREENCRWQMQERYSLRQQKRMNMDGISGRFLMQGTLSPLLPLLIVGEQLHCGKNTVFGLGRYQIRLLG